MKILLCAIGRKENKYARDWVEYHKNIGITKILILDNNHDGEEHFEDVIGDYIDSGFKSIKAKHIDELKGFEMNSTEYREYQSNLKEAKKITSEQGYTLKSDTLTESDILIGDSDVFELIKNASIEGGYSEKDFDSMTENRKIV